MLLEFLRGKYINHCVVVTIIIMFLFMFMPSQEFGTLPLSVLYSK